VTQQISEQDYATIVLPEAEGLWGRHEGIWMEMPGMS